MVWFNERRDEWLQMRQTTMKIAPVSMTTNVNNRHIDNRASSFENYRHHHQQQRQQLKTDATAQSPADSPAG